MADFESKYTGLEIESILDYAHRQKYKVNLEIQGMPRTSDDGSLQYDGRTPYVVISGLPENVDLNQVKIKLFRRGVFQRNHKYTLQGTLPIEASTHYKQRGWIHPRHGSVPFKWYDNFIPPYGVGESAEYRNILSEFNPANYNGGMITPVSHPDIDSNTVSDWAYILGAYGSILISGKTVKVKYGIGKRGISKTSTAHAEGNPKCALSKPYYGVFGMAVYYQETRVSPIVPFNVSVAIMFDGINPQVSRSNIYISMF